MPADRSRKGPVISNPLLACRFSGLIVSRDELLRRCAAHRLALTDALGSVRLSLMAGSLTCPGVAAKYPAFSLVEIAPSPVSAWPETAPVARETMASRRAKCENRTLMESKVHRFPGPVYEKQAESKKIQGRRCTAAGRGYPLPDQRGNRPLPVIEGSPW